MQWQIGIDSDGLLLHVYDIMKAMSLTLVAFLFWDLNGDMEVYMYSAYTYVMIVWCNIII